MPARNPADRKAVATIAALTRWSNEDPRANAERGQAGLRRKFEDQVDPERALPEVERQRRADCAYRAHMVRIRRAQTSARAARDAA